MKRVFDLFKIKPKYQKNYDIYYKSALKNKINEKTRKELTKDFEVYNNKLYKLIGKDLKWEKN